MIPVRLGWLVGPDIYSNPWLGFFSVGEGSLRLAPFVARLEGAGVPGLILGMDGTEPPPADTAVESCLRIAGLING